MRQIQIGGVTETVVERSDYPPERLRAILGKETVAALGYGVQGRGQSLNMKDNGVKVIVGQREGTKSWDLARQDGWVPGQTLFSLEEAAQRGTIIQYLLSDAGQKDFWPQLKPHLTAGKALYFSHGFSIVYKDQTGVVPPPDVDVVLVAPKGSGTTVRRLFLEGRGINASFAIFQDATGRAASRNALNQSRAPRWAVVEQLAYIQSMPFSAISGYRLWVASSTVSLNASLGEWPCSRSTSYCASHRP